jgi:hypothetical protein
VTIAIDDENNNDIALMMPSATISVIYSGANIKSFSSVNSRPKVTHTNNFIQTFIKELHPFKHVATTKDVFMPT